jgi:hypothetical protein
MDPRECRRTGISVHIAQQPSTINKKRTSKCNLHVLFCFPFCPPFISFVSLLLSRSMSQPSMRHVASRYLSVHWPVSTTTTTVPSSSLLARRRFVDSSSLFITIASTVCCPPAMHASRRVSFLYISFLISALSIVCVWSPASTPFQFVDSQFSVISSRCCFSLLYS